jgi:molybdate transport system substrate-binding protein
VLLASFGCRERAEDAGPLRVAAASSLRDAFGSIGYAFEQRTGNRVTLSYGASGLLAEQIGAGAPFDVFASADVELVDRAIAAGACRAESKVVFARGRVVLWWPEPSKVEPPHDLTDLALPRFARIAIANPEHAPYGRAAKQALISSGMWRAVEPKIVYADNAHHALTLASTGNAEVAVVAASVAVGAGKSSIDARLHAPIDHAIAACGRRSVGNAFVAFVRWAEGRSILEASGFSVP